MISRKRSVFFKVFKNLVLVGYLVSCATTPQTASDKNKIKKAKRTNHKEFFTMRSKDF